MPVEVQVKTQIPNWWSYMPLEYMPELKPSLHISMNTIDC